MAEETKIGIKLEEEAKPIKKMCEKLIDAVNYELDKGIENVDAKELGEVVDMIKDLYEAKKEMYEACYYKSVLEAMEEHEFEDEEEIMDEGRRGYRGQPRSESGRFMSRGDGRRSNRGGRSRGRGSRRGYDDTMMMYDDIDWDDMEWMRDIDRPMGRMGYSSGNMGTNSMGSQSGSQGQSGGGSSSSGMSGGSMSSQGGGRGYSDGGRDMREGRSGERRRGYMEAKEQGKDKQQKMKELEEYMKSMAEDLTEAIEGATPEERAMAKNKLSVLVQKM